MSVIRTIIAELVGLFIDDGLFAAAVVIWILLIGLVAPTLDVPALWRSVLMFAGLAVILIESVARRARSS